MSRVYLESVPAHGLPFAPLGACPLNVVLFGPPGAGKGTQAERFAHRHKIPKISTGEILRRAVQDASPLGALVRDTLQRGVLVNDELVIGVVRERLAQPDTANGFVLDGFPRTLAQAHALDSFVSGLLVIALDVTRDELVRRLSMRGRADDDRDVILQRLDTYANETAPVLDYYRRRGVVAVVKGDQTPEAVSRAIALEIVRSTGHRRPA